MDTFYEYVNRKYSWLGGVVFGPWIKTPVDSMRKIIDPSIPIRMYPDITHSLSAQYPVPDWDLAYAMTLGRECINPRPTDEKHIHNRFAHNGTGSISYSEGTNDDVNKFIWSDQDWDPQLAVEETLQDYARLFISADYAKSIAAGIMELEANFRGPLVSNKQVSRTIKHFQELEKHASAEMMQNFRFQMCLLRAYYDAYIQMRLIHEMKLEQLSLKTLSQAKVTGSASAMAEAKAILKKAGDPASYNIYKTIVNNQSKLSQKLVASGGFAISLKKASADDLKKYKKL